MPASITLLTPRLRSWRARSFDCGPKTLWGLVTTVLPSLMYGLYRSSQSAPDPREVGQIEWIRAVKHLDGVHQSFEGALEPPPVIVCG